MRLRLLLLLSACGCADAGGATDLGPPDAGAEAGWHTLGSLGPPADAGSAMRADGGDPAARRVDALNAAVAASCACRGTRDGYDSAARCKTVRGIDARERQCEVTALAASPEDVPALACMADAAEQVRDCELAAPCVDTEIRPCAGTWAHQTAECPRTSDAYDGLLAGCEQTQIVGSAPDLCDDASPASSALGDAVFTGTTLLAGNHRSPTSAACPPAPGADVALHWVAPSAGTYVIDTAGSSLDIVLYVRTSCDDLTSTELACAADDIRLTISSVTVTLAASQSIEIVVDSQYASVAGDFVVNIRPE